jgi:uroporphyrin-III C-methyltransferase/precorrin-2 dehydrogenase/sirohydrochlorin ferrochelatase
MIPRSASTGSPRIGALAVLPVFFRLDGRRVVVTGAGSGAAWKAELLAQAGALVDVYAPDPDPALCRLADGEPAAVTLHRRHWRPDDLEAAALVVGDVEDDSEADRLAAAAQLAGVPVNVVDKPAYCDFQFGSVVNRSPLVVGISTDGAAPVFGQAIRSRIETILPAGLQRWAEAAWSWRPLIQRMGLPFGARRRIWERFTREALRDPGRAPTPDDRDAFLALAGEDGLRSPPGSVALVGAGPGDPELLTLKAVRLLQSADVILHDDLVSAAILDFARREAERIVVGKRGHRPSCRQDHINALMVSLAREGRRVVRLKGGDPLVFGRAGEEIAACRAAGIPVEVVPGITAALGAAASLEVSLTHRDHARRLQLVTAHSKEGRLPDDLDWAALADPAATTAVYMGKAVLGPLADRLVNAGLDQATLALIIENATRGDQTVLEATVGTMAATLADAALEGPCVMLIGQALGEARRGLLQSPTEAGAEVTPA